MASWLPERSASFVLAALVGCGGGSSEPPGRRNRASDRRSPEAGRPAVVFLGTSLTAGLGVSPEEAFPALIARRVESAGLGYAVVNAGVSGETSAGALRRVDWVLRRPVAVLVVETGANDGLRGQDPGATRENLKALLSKARRASPPPAVVVLGMQAPPNLGAEYTARFRAVFPDVAADFGAPLVPFLLEGVAGDPALNQEDGIHPNAAGHRRMAETVWPVLRRVLEGQAASSTP